MRYDIIGKEFGYIKVISKTDKRPGRKESYWLCLCKCGNSVILPTYRVRKGPSCGCQKINYKRGKDSVNWKGCGDLSSNYFSSIKNSAKLRNIYFDISIEYAWELYKKQNGKCALTGKDIFLIGKNGEMSSCGSYTASLDRIDSQLGYIEGNVQWLDKNINFMKLDFSQEEFIRMCSDVYLHNKEIYND